MPRWSAFFKHRDKNDPSPASASASTELIHENLPYGLKILVEGVDPVLDIVAVHGLNGHREKTWTANNVNWLHDFLPSDIPNARILTWGYDANTHSTSQLNTQYLYDHAQDLVSDLCLDRKLAKIQRRPIIFIAHSLGGIVVKSALIRSDSARKDALEEHRSIKLSTYGIFFMGTPHQGGNGVHFGQLMINVASIFVRADDKILKHLEQNSEWLQQQLDQYGPISNDFVTKFAYETYPTTLALGTTILVVPKSSAVIPGMQDAEAVAIPADHLNMVKFFSRENSGYMKISGHLRLLAQDAPGAIDVFWAEQDKMRNAPSTFHEDFSVSLSLSGVPEVESFVGRHKELVEIKDAFQQNESHRRIVVLQGLGGIGKTQLAITFLKQQQDAYSAIFWLDGKNEDILKQSFANMAKRLYNKYPASTLLATAATSKDPDQIIDAMKQWLSVKGNTQWMLVFDNIDKPKLSGVKDSQAYKIESYFPEAHQGSILVITRSSRLRIGKVIRLKQFENVQESIAILAHTSGRQISDQDPGAVELAKKLDGLPLALATAGAYLHAVPTSLEKYVHHYDTSWLKLQETSPELSSYEDRALYSTWNISYEHICSQNESAGKLLKLWGYFDNQDLWYSLLARGKLSSPEWFLEIISDELSFNKAIMLLRDHALIESYGASDGYGMHNCVHAWIKYVLNSELDISMIDLSLNCVARTVPKRTDHGYWAIERRLLPHGNRCFEVVHNDIVFNSMNRDHIMHDVHRLGTLFLHQGKLNEAENMYLQALKGKEKACGFDHTSTLMTVRSLGNLFCDQGKMVEAEKMYLRALKEYEKTYDFDPMSTFDTVNNLGLLYKNQKNLIEAEKMFLRALNEYEKINDYDHPSTLDTVNNLGVLYAVQKNLIEAEKMYLRALKGSEKIYGHDHPSTLDTVNNLGLLYENQGKLIEAEKMFLRALKEYEKTNDFDHPSTLETVNNLGVLYADQGNLIEAEKMFLRALEGYEKTYDHDHSSTLDTLNNLGVLYADQGNLIEAEKMLLQALAGREKVLGFEHKKPLDTRYNLAFLYEEKHQFEDAMEQWKLVAKGYTKVLGADHRKTIRASKRLEKLQSRLLKGPDDDKNGKGKMIEGEEIEEEEIEEEEIEEEEIEEEDVEEEKIKEKDWGKTLRKRLRKKIGRKH